jgi:sensor histidine kinase YesM
MEKMCTLNEEKEYIFNYLKIMNLRFGNGISLEFHIEESLAECRVPRFILQPIVENSITHGMKKPQNSINICVEAYSENDELFIIVSDNGIGISEDKLMEINSYLAGLKNENLNREDGSIGLYNVNRRICLNFGNKSGVRLESREGDGTRALIRLPLNT